MLVAEGGTESEIHPPVEVPDTRRAMMLGWWLVTTRSDGGGSSSLLGKDQPLAFYGRLHFRDLN